MQDKLGRDQKAPLVADPGCPEQREQQNRQADQSNLLVHQAHLPASAPVRQVPHGGQENRPVHLPLNAQLECVAYGAAESDACQSESERGCHEDQLHRQTEYAGAGSQASHGQRAQRHSASHSSWLLEEGAFSPSAKHSLASQATSDSRQRRR